VASEEFENLLLMLGPLRGQLTADGLLEFRTGYENMGALFAVPDDVEIETVDAAGVAGELVTPAGAVDDAAVLYLHGGGYVIGSPDSHRSMVAHLVKRLGAPALLIDYRLAPEHTFPAALDDAVAAYIWLRDRVGAGGRVAIAGDSAGGGLTAATLLALKQRDLPQPEAAVAISPWADLELMGDSMASNDSVDVMVGRDSLTWMADHYLAGHDPRDPLASPIHGEFDGCAPLLIHVGERETLLDDARRLADRASDHGVDVQLHEASEMIHVWHFFAGTVPEADRGLDDVAAFLRPYLDIS
jgi:epsilon-lactone hydrolase